jgi:hypothetical protein
MDWIFDNFQILAIVGIALASWLKRRADAKAAEREEREARRELEEPQDVFGPEQEWREPQQWSPPPMPPPLVVTPPPLPAAAQEAEEELKHQMQLQERMRLLRESKAVTTGGAASTRTRTATRQTGYSEPVASAAPAGLRGVLRKRSEIRRAVILREVLGPPLGLR